MYTEGERERSRQRWMTKSIASQPSNEREEKGGGRGWEGIERKELPNNRLLFHRPR